MCMYIQQTIYQTKVPIFLSTHTDLPLSQAYASSVGVGSLLTIGPVVTPPTEGPIVINDVQPLSVDAVDKSFLLKNLKLSFTNRTYHTLTYSEIPSLLSELTELRKAYHSTVLLLPLHDDQKEDAFTNTPPEEIINPLVSQLPELLEEYKSLVQNLKKCYECPTCNKAFTTRFSLTTHLTTHSDIKPFECPHTGCGKCFRTKSALSTHMNTTHAEAKQHICGLCGKSFAKLWLLRQHEVRHNANHRYSCPKCNLSFAYPYQVGTEGRIHCS